MEYKDRVYGKTNITEPVVLELINDPSIQRLKGVDQIGYFEPFSPGSAWTRYEHSIGVFLLLKMYGASLEEQVAGLIHDVSHSAFSHCADYALDAGSEKDQSHQDNVFADFVRNSEIPEIIEKHGLRSEYILDDKNFPLKETLLPDLCADRIDYSLKTAMLYKIIDNGAYFLQNLTAQGGKWIFKNFESAKKFAQLFLKLNTDYYTSFLGAVMFRTVGDYLKHALKKGYISETDLYTTDREVFLKIEPHMKSDSALSLLHARMNNKVPFRNDPLDYHAKVACKSRVVDPLCVHKGEIKRVSEIEPSWAEVVRRESEPKEYYIKFEQ